MSETKNAPTSVEEFEAYYEEHKKTVQELFEKDGYHFHGIFLFVKDKPITIVAFDSIMHQAIEILKQHKPDLDIESGRYDHELKDMTYHAIAGLVSDLGAIGFIEVAEAWGIMPPLEDGVKDPEKASKAHNALLEKHETHTIKDIPGRFELLTVTARFMDKSYTCMWKIGRREKTAWLHDFQEMNFDDAEAQAYTKQGVLHKAIDAVLAR